MANVLTMGSTILCGVLVPLKAHGGTVATTSSAKLTVGNNAVLLASSLGAISGCQNAPPPTGATPCKKVLTVLPISLATKLQAGGSSVLLDSLAGTTDGTPVGPLNVTANQTKLTAV